MRVWKAGDRLGIILAILIFSLIILFHEFGHFLAAKKCGVAVIEFSLGMGPRLISFEKGGTRYSWKLLPFGGSCMMKGEDGDGGQPEPDSFAGRPVWARIIIAAAGPVFNFLLAYIMSVILIACIGVDKPVLLGVTDGYPAARAGMQAGDEITKIGRKSIHFYQDVTSYVTFHQDEMAAGKEIDVTYLRDGQKYTVKLKPEDNGNGRYILGIYGDSNYRTRVSVPAVAGYSFYEVGYWIESVFQGLKMLFTGEASVSDLSGPVGVVQMVDETVEETKSDGAFYVFVNLLNLGILLSANLGVMNLLPFPALDGGRIFLLLLEAVRRKRLNPEIEGRINLVGFALLMTLMVFVMYQDILRIIK